MGFSEPFLKCIKQLKKSKKIECAMYIVCAIIVGVFFFIVADDSRLQAIEIGVLFLFIPVIIAFGVAFFVTQDYAKKMMDLYRFYGQEIAVPVAEEVSDTSLDFLPNDLDESKINPRVSHRFFFNGTYKKLVIHGTSKLETHSRKNVFGKTTTVLDFDGIIGTIDGIKDSPAAIKILPKNIKKKYYMPEKYFEFKTNNPEFDNEYIVCAKVPALGEKYLTKELIDVILAVSNIIGPIKLDIDRAFMEFVVHKPCFGEDINIKKELDYNTEISKARAIKEELVSFLDAFSPVDE